MHRVNAEAPSDTMLAIGRKNEVLLAERSPGAHLSCLLAKAGSPQPKFALTLQRGRFGVDPAGQHHVVIEAFDLIIVAAEGVLRVFQPLPFRGEQLYQLDFSARTADVAHGCILSSTRCGGSASHQSRCGIAALGGTPTLRGSAGSGGCRPPAPPEALVWLRLAASASGFLLARLHLLGGSELAHPNVPPTFRRRENHSYVLPLWAAARWRLPQKLTPAGRSGADTPIPESARVNF